MRARYFLIAGAAVLILIVSVAAGIGLKHAVVAPTPDAAAAPTRPLVKFTMKDPAGRIVTEKDFHGHWTMVLFGFTHCPDVCPLSMLYATDLLKDLGLLADSLQVVFITVDPGRDTDDVLIDYLTNFDPRIVALRGNAQQTADTAKVFGAYYAIRPPYGADGEEYNVEHSNAFYLVDPGGRLQRAFALKQGQGGAFLNKEIRATIFTSPKE